MKNFIKSAVSSLLLAFLVFALVCAVFYKPQIKSFFSKPIIPESVTYDNSQRLETSQEDIEYFYYETLNSQEQSAYEKIYRALLEFDEDIYVSTSFDDNEVFSIFCGVLGDHPEIYWVNGKISYSSLGRVYFDYIHTKEECDKIDPIIRERTKELMSGVNLDADEYERSLKIYELVAQNVKYEKTDGEYSYRDATIEGALVYSQAVCSGYSRTYQYLLSLAGLSSAYISGYAERDGETEGHAWVMQKLDENYYYTDPTWADSFEDVIDGKGVISYSYFCLSDEEMALDHTLDDGMPFYKSESAEDNYFIREGLYVEKELSPDELADKVYENIERRRLEDGGVLIELKYSSQKLYADACDTLIEKGRLDRVISEIDGVNLNTATYSCDDLRYVITIYLSPAGEGNLQ